MGFDAARNREATAVGHPAGHGIARGAYHIEGMQAWSASALRAYYAKPVVGFREAALGGNGSGSARATAAGFYIESHCQPDCCSAAGLPSHIGPFVTAAGAHRWSRRNLR